MPKYDVIVHDSRGEVSVFEHVDRVHFIDPVEPGLLTLEPFQKQVVLVARNTVAVSITLEAEPKS